MSAITIEQDLAGTVIPVLDLEAYRAGAPGAAEALGRQLYDACTRVGFYYIRNHGVPKAVTAELFRQSKRFHAQPASEKNKLKVNANKIGYLELATSFTRHAGALTDGRKPNLNASFVLRREIPPDDPDLLAGKPFTGLNQWPDNLPGFRDGCVAYLTAMEDLGRSLLPIYSAALGMPHDFFAAAFRKPTVSFRLLHYPSQGEPDGEQYGLAPHADNGFLTILAQSEVPGLAIRTSEGRWVAAPALEDHFLINTGDLLRRWTNDRFLSTPHMVINQAGVERYSAPYFFHPNLDTMIECLPTCVAPGEQPKHPPVLFLDHYRAFVSKNYPTVTSATAAAA
jgi:isopenicillin N synthase-like dioxygenase